MKKVFLLIFCSSLRLFSSTDKYFNQAIMSAEPSVYVDGCVNVISGDYVISHPTITIQGAEPIKLDLQYISSNSGGLFSGWNFQANVTLIFDKENNRLECTEKNGVVLSYSLDDYSKCKKEKSHRHPLKLFDTKKAKKNREKHNRKISQARDDILEGEVNEYSYKQGLCHCPYRDFSGRKNLKNNRVFYSYRERLFTIHTPSGEKRYYREVVKQPRKFNKEASDCVADVQLLPTHRSQQIFLLEREELPNGNICHYEYDKYNHLIGIRTSNVDDTKTYAWVKILYKMPSYKSRSCSVKTSDGKNLHIKSKQSDIEEKQPESRVNYHLRNNMKFVKWFGQPIEHYEYSDGKLSKRSFSSGDPLCIAYTKCFSSKKKQKKTTEDYSGRVSHISTLKDDGRGYFFKRKFFYFIDFDKSSMAHTDVYDACENKTRYLYQKDLRLREIQFFEKKSENKKCLKKVNFVWGKEEDEEVSCLIAKNILKGDGSPVASQRYYYDERGNVVEEKLFGNLSGECQEPLALNKENLPQEEGGERYCKRRTFSDDGKNLLLEEVDDNGLGAMFSYYKDTDLIESKLILSNGVVKIRNFFEYNNDNILVRTIVDDGDSEEKNDLSGVSERRITTYVPKDHGPFVGMPANVEERYLDLAKDQERLIERRDIHYSDMGFIEKEDVYDDQNQYRYSTSMNYDDEGRPVLKANALGFVQTIKYNDLFLEKEFIDYGARVKETKEYDGKGRLRVLSQKGDDGIKHTESFNYDRKGNLTSSADYLGNTAKYEYSHDDQPIKEIKPKVRSADKKLIMPTETTKYDGLGRPIEKGDAKGNVTKYWYNSYNKPILIEYPDLSTEKFIYNLDGTLRAQIDPIGTETRYEYDFLNRVVSIKVFTAEGCLLSRESNTYSSFHQFSHTDANGNTTRYYYDGAGRKIREETVLSKKDIEYDELGREYKVIHHVRSGNVISITEKDYLDRVIEERVEDQFGNVQYLQRFKYDKRGNKTTVINYIDEKECKITYLYDSLNRLIQKIDAEGNASHIQYDESYRNTDRQRCLKKVTTDPLHRKTIEVFDPLQRRVLLEKRSDDGRILDHEEFDFDERDHLVQERREVLFEGEKRSDHSVYYEYDEMERKTLQREGDRSKISKTYEYGYDERGLLTWVKKPDSTFLRYTYDYFGRNISIISSDNKCNISYTYDQMGNMLSALDMGVGQSSRKEYDPEGRLVREIMMNGLSKYINYDELGRQTELIFHDGSRVEYIYDGVLLRGISRKAAGGEELYYHEFTNYDLQGNCLGERMISGLGDLHKEYNSNGQILSIASPYVKQNVMELDPVGKILQLDTHSSQRDDSISYEYDDLDQLVSENGSFFTNDYRCDSLSNRLEKNQVESSVNELNQHLSDGKREYQYDENGNPVLQESDKRVEYSYDPLDRLMQVNIGNHTWIEYRYDEQDRRVAKKKIVLTDRGREVAQDVRYLFDGEKEVGEVDANDQMISFRVMNPTNKSEINGCVVFELEGCVYSPLHDLRGNVIGLVGVHSQSLDRHYCYSAFGEELEANEMKGVNNPWRFCSKRVDEDLEMVFFGKRFYDPSTGRWITPDPSGFSDGANLYSYVKHSPISFVDHYGLYCETIDFSLKFDTSGMTAPISFPWRDESQYFSQWFTSDERLEIDTWRRRYKQPSSYGFVGETRILNKMILMMNGIDTKLNEAQDYAKTLSKMGNGVEVNYIHNASNGLYQDLRESDRNLVLHHLTEPSLVAKKVMELFLYFHPEGKVLLVVHSQGAILGRNALEKMKDQYRKRISVCAVAPGALINKKICAGVSHYLTRGDIVPRLDFSGRKDCLDTCVMIKSQKKIGIMDHSFLSKTYQQSLSSTIYDFVEGGL